MEEATLRVARLDDIIEMHRVRLAVHENRLSSPDRVRAEDYERILADGGRAWVVETDRKVVGFAVADLSRANVWALFVDPLHEGHGLGRRLHDAMMTWMFSAGLDSVWLTTAPGTRAEAFYNSAGWKDCGTVEGGEIRFELSRGAYLTPLTPGPAQARRHRPH